MSGFSATDAQREAYRETGYMVLSGWLPESQLDALDAAANTVPHTRGAFHTYETVRGGEQVHSRTEGFIWAQAEQGGGGVCALRTVSPHTRLSCVCHLTAEVVPASAMAPFLGNGGTLARAIESLIGEGPVALYKEKINYKLAGGGGYRSHQDGYATLPRNTADNSAPYSFMTQVCMLALDNMTLANGCPELAPETWRKKEGWLSHGKTNMSAAEGASTGYPADEQVSPQRCHRALSW
jgi:hypothetical protein